MTEHGTKPPFDVQGYEVLGNYQGVEPTEADQTVLKELVSHGADLTRARDTVHYLYFPDSASREAAAFAVHALGYEICYGKEPSLDGTWLLTASVICVLDEGSISKQRDELTGVAGQHDGEYDGWEAALDS